MVQKSDAIDDARMREIEEETLQLFQSRAACTDSRQAELLAEEIFELNQGLALRYSSRFRNEEFGADYDAAALGALHKAILKFDPTLGTPFHHYARSIHIRPDVLEAVRLFEFPDWPSRLFLLRLKVKKAEERLLAAGKEVTDTALASVVGCSASEVAAVNAYEARSPISIENDFDDRSEPTAPPEIQALNALEREASDQALGRLHHRELMVVIRRFGLDGEPPSTYEEIARFLGKFSRETIRNMEKKALKKLRVELSRSRR